jgi:hypothetical protein
LMTSFLMVVRQVLSHRAPQRLLPEEDHAVKALRP